MITGPQKDPISKNLQTKFHRREKVYVIPLVLIYKEVIYIVTLEVFYWRQGTLERKHKFSGEEVYLRSSIEGKDPPEGCLYEG